MKYLVQVPVGSMQGTCMHTYGHTYIHTYTCVPNSRYSVVLPTLLYSSIYARCRLYIAHLLYAILYLCIHYYRVLYFTWNGAQVLCALCSVLYSTLLCSTLRYSTLLYSREREREEEREKREERSYRIISYHQAALPCPALPCSALRAGAQSAQSA